MQNDNMFDLDALLASTDLNKVTSDGAGFEELPQGYYLCEVAGGEFTTNKQGYPMVKMTLTTLYDGLCEQLDEDGKAVEDEDGNLIINQAPKTAGRKIFKNFTLKDADSIKRFVSDMLKFESTDNPGESMLSREYFGTKENIVAALECVKGLTIFVRATLGKATPEYPTPSNFYSFVSWKNVDKLGLLEMLNVGE